MTAILFCFSILSFLNLSLKCHYFLSYEDDHIMPIMKGISILTDSSPITHELSHWSYRLIDAFAKKSSSYRVCYFCKCCHFLFLGSSFSFLCRLLWISIHMIMLPSYCKWCPRLIWIKIIWDNILVHCYIFSCLHCYIFSIYVLQS